jgi:hypothetical protein
MTGLPFTADQDGGITYIVPHLENHQMAVIELA